MPCIKKKHNENRKGLKNQDKMESILFAKTVYGFYNE